MNKLLSSRQVAEFIGIDRRNMNHQRKTKGFPQPIMIDKFPAWIESEVTEWKEQRENAKNSK